MLPKVFPAQRQVVLQKVLAAVLGVLFVRFRHHCVSSLLTQTVLRYVSASHFPLQVVFFLHFPAGLPTHVLWLPSLPVTQRTLSACAKDLKTLLVIHPSFLHSCLSTL